MLKAILFDLDDTLIDWSGFNGSWETIEAEHLRRVFDFIRDEGHPIDDFETFRTLFRQRTLQAWDNARENLVAPNMGTVLVETAEALGVRPGVLSPRRCLEVHTWSIIAGTAPFPEVPEVLASLQEKGIKLGIVTNAYQPMWMRDIEIEGHGLLPFFPECRLSAADVGYLKPHPVIFQTALECLGTRPEETVFVGDNPLADVMGAKRAGLRAVLRRTNTVENAIGEAIEPDHVVNDLLELIDILAKWYPDWDR